MTKSYWESEYQEQYAAFLDGIIRGRPDFIVPVGRKSAKLIDAVRHNLGEFQDHIHYLEYFDFITANLRDARIAIVDDAVRTASTLKGYRDYFESYVSGPPREIQTYGFIGHSQLRRYPQKNRDKNTRIKFYRPESSYQEYMAQQAEFLIRRGTQPDIDHMVIELEVSEFGGRDIQSLWEFLPNLGYFYQLETIGSTERFGLHSPSFFPFEDILKNLGLEIRRGFADKIKFCHLRDAGRFQAIPMIFPEVLTDGNTQCSLEQHLHLSVPFALPCQYREHHKQDKICYQSVCLLLNALLARSFFLVLREQLPTNEISAKKFSLKRKDLTRYLGNEIGNKLVDGIEQFIRADHTPIDELLVQRKPAPKYHTHGNYQLPINRENVPLIFKEMRDEYAREVKRASTPDGVRVVKTADEMMSIGSGTHPLIFTELLDEYCDTGALVPVSVHSDIDDVWRRVYRTGEGNDDHLSWERTKFIIAFAIEELGSDGAVARMLLEKALTNFAFDFPLPELHTLGEQESLWGPQVFADFRTKNVQIPLDPRNLMYERLYDWKTLAEYFDYDKKRGMYTRTRPFKAKSSYFGREDRTSERLIRQYFQTLAQVRADMGTSDVIYSLAICRKRETFIRYLHKSIQIWLSAFEALLNGIRNGKVDENCLKDCGVAARSAREKVKYANSFNTDLKKASELLEPKKELFAQVWQPLIWENIGWDSHPLSQYPEVQLLICATDCISLLFELTRLKLGNAIRMTKRSETEDRLGHDGQVTLESLGIPGTILHWPDRDELPMFEEIVVELSEADATLRVMIENINIERTPSLVTQMRRWQRQDRIVVSTTPAPSDDVDRLCSFVRDYAVKIRKGEVDIVGVADLSEGIDDGNKFVTLRDRYGYYWAVEVIRRSDELYVRKFSEIKSH